MSQTNTAAGKAMLSLAANALFGAPLTLERDTDFEALFAAVGEQAMLGVLSEGLSTLPEDAVPLAVMQRWQSHAVAILRKNAALLEAQSGLLALCREAGAPAVILKGFSAALSYPVPDLRASGDIDCLVPPAHLAALCALLEREGYLREEGLDEHHVAYCKDGVMLEIHFKVSGLPDGAVGEESTFDEMMAQAVQRGTEEALRSAFSLAEDELILTVSEVDTKTHLPTSVSVVLYGRGTLKDTRAMEQYLKEKGGFRNVNISIHLGA